MSYSLVFNTEVETDVKEAYDWYEEQQSGLGDRFEAAIEHQLSSILKNPQA